MSLPFTLKTLQEDKHLCEHDARQEILSGLSNGQLAVVATEPLTYKATARPAGPPATEISRLPAQWQHVLELAREPVRQSKLLAQTDLSSFELQWTVQHLLRLGLLTQIRTRLYWYSPDKSTAAQPITPVTFQQYHQRLGSKHQDARMRLLRELRNGKLHIVTSAPLSYSVQPPQEPVPVPEAWQNLLKLCGQPQTFADLMEATGINRNELRWQLIHLLSLGALYQPAKGLYWTQAEPLDKPRKITQRRTTPRYEAARKLREERLAAVSWPAGVREVARCWGLPVSSANAYLLRLKENGYLVREDGLYRLA
ncbi:hypothetical protein [Deinococcus sp. Marseille-Q6407]|uniref:hypothetical protein n=1 Tax=Deinococcus sp. Marseille-Q6407 TaxID=2969223 RepID=UPI0021C2185D|nr:hypothetical protein [Deinococcus sp. Marseille-Q6407]